MLGQKAFCPFDTGLLRTFDPGINKNLDKRKKAYYSNVSRNCFKNRKRYREKGSDKEEYLFIQASERIFHRLKEYLAVDTGKVALEPED